MGATFVADNLTRKIAGERESGGLFVASGYIVPLTGLQSRHQEQRAVECHGTMHIASAHEILQFAPRARFQKVHYTGSEPQRPCFRISTHIAANQPSTSGQEHEEVNPTTPEKSLSSWCRRSGPASLTVLLLRLLADILRSTWQ